MPLSSEDEHQALATYWQAWQHGHALPWQDTSAQQALVSAGLLTRDPHWASISLRGVALLDDTAAAEAAEETEALLVLLEDLYRRKRTQRFQVQELAVQYQEEPTSFAKKLTLLLGLPIWIRPERDAVGMLASFALSDVALYTQEAPLPDPPQMPPQRLWSFSVDGYGPFLRFHAPLEGKSIFLEAPSESGASALFRALRFLQRTVQEGLSLDWEGQGSEIFHKGAPEAIRFSLDWGSTNNLRRYELELHGEGPPSIFREKLSLIHTHTTMRLAATKGRGLLCQEKKPLLATSPQTTLLGSVDDPYCQESRQFFSSLWVDNTKQIIYSDQFENHSFLGVDHDLRKSMDSATPLRFVQNDDTTTVILRAVAGSMNTPNNIPSKLNFMFPSGQGLSTPKELRFAENDVLSALLFSLLEEGCFDKVQQAISTHTNLKNLHYQQDNKTFYVYTPHLRDPLPLSALSQGSRALLRLVAFSVFSKLPSVLAFCVDALSAAQWPAACALLTMISQRSQLIVRSHWPRDVPRGFAKVVMSLEEGTARWRLS